MPQAARRRVLVTAASAAFANFLAFLGLTPLYPSVAHDLGLAVDSLGVYFGISSAVGVVLQVPVGVLADRLGRRRILVVGLVFMALGQVLRWQASTPLVFALSQLAIGLCSPFVVAPTYALIADAFSDSGRTAALGVLQAAISLGSVAGYLLAGLLGPLLGWRGYSLVLVVLPVLLMPLTLSMPEPPRRQRVETLAQGTAAAFRFLFLPAAAALAAIAAIGLGSGFSATYLLPFEARAHGYAAGATSLLLVPYVMGSVVGAPLTGRWADRAGPRLPLLTGLLVAAAALALFGSVGFSAPAVLVCYLLVGAGVSTALSIAASSMADIAAHRHAGTGAAMGGLRVGQQIGPAIGPALAGLVYARAGSATAYFALAAALVLAAGAGIAVTSRFPQPAPGREPT